MSSLGSTWCSDGEPACAAQLAFDPRRAPRELDLLTQVVIRRFAEHEVAKRASLPEPLYRIVPLKAVVFWDFHGFNVTESPRAMQGWINLTFAADRQRIEQRLADRRLRKLTPVEQDGSLP